MATQSALPFDITARKHGGNPESGAANRRIHDSKQAVRLQIMAYAKSRGILGVTADEVAEHFDCTANHVAPRISEMLAMKPAMLIRTHLRRKTRSGCSARVLLAAN